MTKVKAKPSGATQQSPLASDMTPKDPVRPVDEATEADQPADHAVIREALLTLRERLTGTVTQLRKQSLTRDDEVNPEEDGTDAFERLFSLERASTDHQVIHQIDEALLALDEGVYGQCEMCGCAIERARLKALPFAKTCVACQSEMERSRGGFHAAKRISH